MISLLKIVPCHRKRDRCLHINGKALPLCARCTGILAGYLFIPLLLLSSWHIPFWIGLLSQLPLLIDGYTQLWKWRTSNNILRLTTGLLSGFGLSVLIVASSFAITALLSTI
ncbi:DUF2085 domain-containing protein [Ectobacillus funiculus]|uniref:DUF2085 domain-containing protein n=1 Tax=Ectobacillus funiculus TaxID=137993 RepID=UPI003978DFEF